MNIAIQITTTAGGAGLRVSVHQTSAGIHQMFDPGLSPESEAALMGNLAFAVLEAVQQQHKRLAAIDTAKAIELADEQVRRRHDPKI